MEFKKLAPITTTSTSLPNYLMAALIDEVVHRGAVLYETSVEGYCETPEELIKIIENRKYPIVSIDIPKFGIGDRVYMIPDTGYITVNEYGEANYDVTIASINSVDLYDLVEEIAPLLKAEIIGTVKMLAQSSKGYHTLDVGRVNAPLIRGNYTGHVLDQYDHLKEEMTSSTPCGRFSLLNGPPGTGKTFFLRGLISEVPRARWLFIPAYIVGSLSGPALAQLLFQTTNNIKAPLVIILEDADNAVKDRKTGNNQEQISEILNLGDGILGEIADIRVIATTNVVTTQLDEALIRPGRLCQHITFNVLTESIWKKRFLELTKKEWNGILPAERSLAHLYREARNAGWKGKDDDVVVKPASKFTGGFTSKPGQYL